MLSESHHQMLTVHSGISESVIQARGYETIDTKAKLKSLGFSDRQSRVSALMIPIWDVNGNIALYHCRPDQPRIEKGKARKYEFPKGSRMALDVPPIVRPMLDDPSKPLWVTEGAKKGDALASHNCCVVSLIGVWNWRGTNGHGGKMALPDWESVALNGRLVYIVFDSDVMTKPEVSAALTRLQAFLKKKGASVLVVYLPSGPSGQKVGVDDYLVQGHSVDDLIALATPHLRPCPHPSPSPQEDYEMTAEGLVWWKPAEHDRVPVRLTNFQAEIVGDIVLDDGIENHRMLELKAGLQGKENTFAIPSREYASLNWVLEHLGPQAVIEPGQSLKDRIRVGIQVLSKNITSRRIFSHTGWTKLDDGEWVYLHADGAIGRNGRVSGEVQVELPQNLSRYRLPSPPTGAALQAAVRASLRFLDTAPDVITLPIYAAIWRVVLGDCPLSLHLVGQTGVHKSTSGALAQQHFGPEMDLAHLPAEWASTANALEILAFHAKDALLVVDDFCPIGDAQNQGRTHGNADRLLRAQANRAGRQRLRSDCTLQNGKPPRGLILSTGEDVPKGASLRARMLVIEVSRGDVDLTVVTKCQKDASSGLYAQAMAGYIQWLAANYDILNSRRMQEIGRIRGQMHAADQHKRTAEIISHLLYGLWYFLLFAESVGALSKAERETFYFDRAEKVLKEAAVEQQQFQKASDPVERFVEFLNGALAAGTAHLADSTGQEPVNPAVWGWRLDLNANSSAYRPQGRRIGWVDKDDMYLEPTTSYAVAQELAQRNQESLTLTPQTLWKRFRDHGLLLSVDPGRETNKVRQTLEGKRREVLHLHTNTFLS